MRIMIQVEDHVVPQPYCSNITVITWYISLKGHSGKPRVDQDGPSLLSYE